MVLVPYRGPKVDSAIGRAGNPHEGACLPGEGHILVRPLPQWSDPGVSEAATAAGVAPKHPAASVPKGT
jgi:uncharacterized Fe-S cluster protein YjdI